MIGNVSKTQECDIDIQTIENLSLQKFLYLGSVGKTFLEWYWGNGVHIMIEICVFNQQLLTIM